jgi:hypothetical protein
MVEAIDPGRVESVGEQGRRQRAHDVGADQTHQYPAFTHDTGAPVSEVRLSILRHELRKQRGTSNPLSLGRVLINAQPNVRFRGANRSHLLTAGLAALDPHVIAP